VGDVPGSLSSAHPTWTPPIQALGSAGFVAGHRIPCLRLEPLAGSRPALPGLEVRRVEDTATLLTFNDVRAEAFALDRPILAVLDDPQMLEVPGFGFHLGLVDGRAVEQLGRASSRPRHGVPQHRRDHAPHTRRMSRVQVDANVLLDVMTDDPHWYAWSAEHLDACAREAELCINPIVYAEVSVGFERIEDLDAALLTRDTTRYRRYYPTVELIRP